MGRRHSGRHSVQRVWHLVRLEALSVAGDAGVQVGEPEGHINDAWQVEARRHAIHAGELDARAVVGPEMHVHAIPRGLPARDFLASHGVEYLFLEAHFRDATVASARHRETFARGVVCGAVR